MPAKSAPAYAHQLHRKERIFGSKLMGPLDSQSSVHRRDGLHPPPRLSSTQEIVGRILTDPCAMTAVVRATAAPAWAIVSLMVLGKWAMPARKTPSGAKSTGPRVKWAS